MTIETHNSVPSYAALVFAYNAMVHPHQSIPYKNLIPKGPEKNDVAPSYEELELRFARLNGLRIEVEPETPEVRVARLAGEAFLKAEPEDVREARLAGEAFLRASPGLDFS